MMNKVMKYTAAMMIAATALLTGTSASVMAYADETATEYQRTCPINIIDTYEVKYVNGVEDFLVLRSDPDKRSDVIGSLLNGQQVIVTGLVESGAVGYYSPYVRIIVNGEEGFVDSSFLGYVPVYDVSQSMPTTDTIWAPQTVPATDTTWESQTIPTTDTSWESQTAPADDTTWTPQPTQEIDTVVYPRVDRYLANEDSSTWCSLNTDGYYYNEKGMRLADNGNGTFTDINGYTYDVIS